MRDALRRSINLVAARLVMGGGQGHHGEINARILVDYAKMFGISTPLRPYPSLAIGSSEVLLIDMVSAFSVFSNLGTRAEPRMVRYVRDRFGREIEAPAVRLTKVLEPDLAYLMVDLMKGVLEPGGTAQHARMSYYVTVPAAGKTGTTNDFSDAWFIGYTPHIVAGVWIGFPDRMTMQLPGGRGVTGIPDPSGAVMAMPVWARFIRDLYRDEERGLPQDDWIRPPGIVEVELCRTSITPEIQDYRIALPTCPDKFTEIFLVGNQPTETCTVHDTSRRRDLRRIPPIPPTPDKQ
jgi:membrane carboxypeptidase/penicillin-binding protein